MERAADIQRLLTQAMARAPARLLEIVTVLAAVWQLYGTAVVRFEQSFTTLLQFLPLALIGGIALVWALGPLLADPPPEAPQPTRSIHPGWALVPAAIAVGAAYAWHHQQAPWWLVWTGLVATAATLVVGTPAAAHPVRATPRTALLLVAAVIAGACLPLWIHLPEGDDAYYLNQVVATVEHPDLPLLSFDGMHGDTRAPIQQVGHKAQLYETLASVVSWLTGHPGGDAYYIYLPPVTGALAVLTTWALAVTLCGRRAGTFATVAFLLIAVSWGGHYYAYGNYTFNRIFQGKGVAFTLGLPLCALFGLRFGLDPNWRTLIYVAAAQIAAASATSSALVIAPVAAALGALAGIRADRSALKVLAGGALSALPCVGMLWLVKMDIDALPKRPFAGERLDVRVLMGGGDDLRTFLGPALLPGVLALGRASGSGLLLRYLLVALLFLYNGVTTDFLGTHAGTHLSWRGYWAVSYPVVLAMGVGIALDRLWCRPSRWPRWVGAGLALASLAGFVRAGPWTFIRTDWADWKVPAYHADVAHAIVGLTVPGSIALLQTHIAERVAGLEGRPKIVNARRIYVRNLERYWGRREALHRQYLLRFVDHGEEVDYEWALQELETRCIDLLVPSRKTHRKYPALPEHLAALGFIRERYGPFSLYYRSKADCRPHVRWRERLAGSTHSSR